MKVAEDTKTKKVVSTKTISSLKKISQKGILQPTAMPCLRYDINFHRTDVLMKITVF